ncbi:MAG: DUF1552 domain-containing protein, partial [Myxococcota bacterium]
MNRTTRRTILRGAGVGLALPFLEALAPRDAKAGGGLVDPFAIFFRQANGVAQQIGSGPLGAEPERFWPQQEGILTPEGVAGRTLDELTDWLDRLLVVGGINLDEFGYGDGHASGAFVGLTAAEPVVAGAGASAEANGESLDRRIGRELNPDGRDAWFLHAGITTGYLGGACISYDGPGDRAAPITRPLSAYSLIAGAPADQIEALIARQKSVNDLLMDEFAELLAEPALSGGDRDRLADHRDRIRDLENNLACIASDEALAEVSEAQSPGGEDYDEHDGDQVLRVVRAHMAVSTIALSCGFTRSVAIQIGNGLDNFTIYRHPETGEPMENFHFLSHRRLSGTSEGPTIDGSDLLHHFVDRQHAQTFRYLLEQLDAVQLPGGTLLDAGIAAWYNDLATGPAHSIENVPWVLAGSAGGVLKQGE